MDSRERLIRRIIRAVRNGRGADFYETVREFDLAAPDLPRTGSADRASGELLRFTQRPSLSEWPETVTDLMQQDASAVLAEIRFFGLCGVDGPMPLGFTEAVCQRTQNEQDPALQRFLDILNHRFIALLYRAFAENSESFSFDRSGDDLHRAALRSMSGAGPEKALPLPPYCAESLVQFSMMRTPGARGLEAALSELLGHSCSIRCNVFSRGLIPQELHCRLGGGESAVLGTSTQIGRFYFSSTGKFEIRMGPMDYSDGLAMLPGTVKYGRIIELVNLYLARPLDFDLVLILRKSSLAAAQLNGKYALGRSIFLPVRDKGGTCTLTINAAMLFSRAGRQARSQYA